MDDHGLMGVALAEARLAMTHDDVPVGALVARDGVVIASGHNRREIDGDPTAHAEVLALRAAAAAVGSWRLDGCDLFATLEPCAMCAGAAVLARVERVVYAAPDPKAGATRSLFAIADDPRLNHRALIVHGLRATEGGDLLRAFFAARRRGGQHLDPPQNPAPQADP